MSGLQIQSQKAAPMQVGQPQPTEQSAPVETSEANYKSPFAN
jgi:hypothetical protein